MNKVYITNEIKVPFKFKRLFLKVLKVLTKFHDIQGKTEVNVIITDNNGIQNISKTYKKKNAPTDVLSFPADYKNLRDMIGYNMLGDIYISHEKIILQSKLYGHPEKREWTYLFTHGLLHLIGFDHMNLTDEKKMNLHARKIMETVKVGR